jgi:hypothetical protein
LVGLDAHALGERDEEVGEDVLVFVDGDVSAMFVTAAGEDEREIGGLVGAGVAEIGAEEDGGGIEEGVGLEFCQEASEGGEFGEFDDFELFDFGFVLAVVREVVPVVFDAFDFRDGVHAVESEGDGAGAVGLEGEDDEILHEVHFADGIGSGLDVGGWFGVDFGFGSLDPGLVLNESAFEVANSGEVFVEFFLVALAKIGVEFFGLAEDGIEDAATAGEALNLGFDFGWGAIDEELLEGA